MSPLVGVLILVLLGLLGSRIAFDPSRAPLGPRLLLTTGTHFLLVGIVLGPILGLLTLDVIVQLEPFLALGLGWIGMLFGGQLDRRQLARFPPAFLGFALVQALFTFFVFAGTLFLVLRVQGGFDQALGAAVLGTAAAAAVSAPSGIALVSRVFRVQGRFSRLLFYVASLDGIVGIVAVQVTYGLFRPTGAAVAGLGWAAWLGIATAIGIIFGVFFLWLTRPKPDHDELALFLLGLVIFEAGAALFLGISPLYVAMITGAMVANLSPSRRRVYSLLHAWDKPIYVVVLILAGALITLETWLVLPLAAGYLALRAAGKIVAAAVARRLIPLPFPAPRDTGMGLISQGGISLAMALGGTLTYAAFANPQAAAVRLAFGTVVIAVATSELIGPFLTRDLLRRAGEITPGMERELEGEEA